MSKIKRTEDKGTVLLSPLSSNSVRTVQKEMAKAISFFAPKFSKKLFPKCTETSHSGPRGPYW